MIIRIIFIFSSEPRLFPCRGFDSPNTVKKLFSIIPRTRSTILGKMTCRFWKYPLYFRLIKVKVQKYPWGYSGSKRTILKPGKLSGMTQYLSSTRRRSSFHKLLETFPPLHFSSKLTSPSILSRLLDTQLYINTRTNTATAVNEREEPAGSLDRAGSASAIEPKATQNAGSSLVYGKIKRDDRCFCESHPFCRRFILLPRATFA